MPFDPNNPPEKVRGLPEKKQRQFVHVFNSCWEKHHDDALCHKMAWGAVKAGKKSCDEMAASIDWDSVADDVVALELRKAAREVMEAGKCCPKKPT